MTRATVDIGRGITAEVYASGDDIGLDSITVTDAADAVAWLADGATDEQLNLMAAALVREQTARDEAAQRIQDEQDAAGHIGRDAQ